MSIQPRKLTSEPFGGRHGYRLESGDEDEDYSEDNTRPVNLGVWDDGFNVEWRTDTDLDDFTDILDQYPGEGIDGADAIAWFGSREMEPYDEAARYPNIKNLANFPEYCGNLRIEGDGFEIYWEDTTGQNTIEVTSSQDEFDLVGYLYEQTVPDEDRMATDELVEHIQTVLEKER